MISASFRTGVSPRLLAERRAHIWTVFAFVAAGLLSICFTRLPHAQTLAISAVLVLFVAFKAGIALLESKIVAGLRSFDAPAAGAQRSHTLQQLGDELLVVDRVLCPFGNIDHVVFSKNHGIFLIEAMPHCGSLEVVNSAIRINGKLPEQDFIAQMLRTSHWLAEELQAITGVSAKVNPLLVFTNAFLMTSRSVKGVTVTNSKLLLPGMQLLARPLAPEIWEAREKVVAVLSALTLQRAA